MDRHLAPVEALAIVDGRILAVGSEDEILPLANWKTKRIDLKGAVVVPGLTDSHFHLLAFGRSLEQLKLVGTNSPEEIADLVVAKARDLPSGTWIRGRGWDQNNWEVQTFPTGTILDEAAPEHPVVLTRIDGHAIWVNSRALTLAGITSETPAPEGGAIIRDENNKPTGVFIDNATALIREALPKPEKDDIRRWLLGAVRRCNKVGLTEIHDPGVEGTTLGIIRELVDEGLFTLRYYGMLDGGDAALLEQYFSNGPVLNYSGYMTIRAVKFYADGALGSRGAALLSPYSDDPGNRGLVVTPPDELEALVKRTFQAGFQPCIHAIGDRGNRLTLDIYERTTAQLKDQDPRPRIEHAQVIAHRDIRRFARLGVLPAMQPSHATSDMYWAEDRLGPERVRGAYAWRQLLNSGSIIPGGSDCPVEREEPLLQLYAARTRQDTSGRPTGGWYPGERMGGPEALKAMTTWSAYAAFEDTTRGKILAGYDADLTVLSVNPVNCDPQALLNARVLMTIVAGQVVWHDKKGFHGLPTMDASRVIDVNDNTSSTLPTSSVDNDS
ncbi:MAG: amidohydrolase [Fidelibacterota bacterium]|nr:MAG: amidohydrolase [Candidatus Neomarinimicrobiota bacterium]